jgi:hypothetical protein
MANGRKNRPSRKPLFLVGAECPGLGATVIAKVLGIGRGRIVRRLAINVDRQRQFAPFTNFPSMACSIPAQGQLCP